MKTNIFMTAFAIVLFAVTAHAINFKYVSEYNNPQFGIMYQRWSSTPPSYSDGERYYEGSNVCWDNKFVLTDSVYVEAEAYDSGLPLISDIVATGICRRVRKMEYFNDIHEWYTSFGFISDAQVTYKHHHTRINSNKYNVLYNPNTNEIILRRWDDSIRYVGTVYLNENSRPKTAGYCYAKNGNKLSKMVTNASHCK